MNISLAQPSTRMTKPYWLEGEKLRRECVIVDGDDVWNFVCACADGDSKSVRRLLEKDCNLLHAQIWYSKPIDHALLHGHLDVVKAIHEFDAENRLAFHINGHYCRCDQEELARRGHRHVVQYLQEEYWPSLMPNYAPEFEAFKNLLKASGSPFDEKSIVHAANSNPSLLRTSDRDGNSALHVAIAHKNLPLAKMLVSLGAATDGRRADGTTVCDLAAHKCPDEISWLLGLGLTPSFHTAVVAGLEEEVRRMVADDPSIVHRMDTDDYSPLALAAKHRRQEMVRLLLELGADPNYPEGDAPNGAALAAACEHQDLGMMTLLLEAGANPNANIDSSGDCWNFCGFGKGDPAEARALLQQHGGKDNDEPDGWDWIDSLEFLRDGSEAEILKVQEDGSYLSGISTATELDLYVERVGTERIVRGPWYEMAKCHLDEELLRRAIHHGLDINRGDWLGRTQLHAAAAWNRVERAWLLLQFGADINAIDAHSLTTPLGYAARNGHIEMVKFLLDSGADKALPTEDRYQWATPIEYARYQLEHYDMRYYPRTSVHWLLTGHRTHRGRKEFEAVIELLV